MSLPIYQRVAVTDAGDVIPGAEYTVINENTGVAAPIYSDRTGATLLTAPYFADSAGTIQFFIAQGTTFRVAASGGVGTYTDRYVYGVAEAVLVQADGNVGIGTSSPDSILQVANTANSTNYISYEIGNNGIGANNKGGFAIYELGSLAASITYARDGLGHTDINANTIKFNNAADTQENMRLSGSNLLVGTTEGVIWNQAATDTSKQGVVIEPKAIQISRFQDTPLLINRQGNDGPLQVLAQDGTAHGSIGVKGGRPYLTNPSYGGLSVADYRINPATAAGDPWDNSLDLGTGGARWKDLHLSGGVYLGGIGGNNKLDYYETGNWTPLVNGVSGSTFKNSYVRIGQQVTVTAFFSSVTWNAGANSVTGIPFTSGRGHASIYSPTNTTVIQQSAVDGGTINFRSSISGASTYLLISATYIID